MRLGGYYWFGDGFFCVAESSKGDSVIVSKDLKVVGTVSAPQKEGPHGLTEPVELDYYSVYCADGLVFTRGDYDGNLYCLDPSAETLEWEKLGEISSLEPGFAQKMNRNLTCFVGKYWYDYRGVVYDISTGEVVYELGNMGTPNNRLGGYYFGGDRFLTYDDDSRAYKWVSILNGAKSDPLVFPQQYQSLTIVSETQCLYTDQYGMFLWNTETGEETTVYMNET